MGFIGEGPRAAACVSFDKWEGKGAEAPWGFIAEGHRDAAYVACD